MSNFLLFKEFIGKEYFKDEEYFKEYLVTCGTNPVHRVLLMITTPGNQISNNYSPESYLKEQLMKQIFIPQSIYDCAKLYLDKIISGDDEHITDIVLQFTYLKVTPDYQHVQQLIRSPDDAFGLFKFFGKEFKYSDMRIDQCVPDLFSNLSNSM